MRWETVGRITGWALLLVALLTAMIAAPAVEAWSASPPTPTPLLLPPLRQCGGW
jgi:hypothetical protein